MTRRSGRTVQLEDWKRDALERATVNVVCAPEDEQRVRDWVAGMNASWPVPVAVRTSCFLRPGRALYWQPDGVHAPSTPRTLAVRLPGSS